MVIKCVPVTQVRGSLKRKPGGGPKNTTSLLQLYMVSLVPDLGFDGDCLSLTCSLLTGNTGELQQREGLMMIIRMIISHRFFVPLKRTLIGTVRVHFGASLSRMSLCVLLLFRIYDRNKRH